MERRNDASGYFARQCRVRRAQQKHTPCAHEHDIFGRWEGLDVKRYNTAQDSWRDATKRAVTQVEGVLAQKWRLTSQSRSIARKQGASLRELYG